jgi:hypothetical protein
MLYWQGFTLLKTREAEKMGKKTAPIAVQGIQKRKAFIRSGGRDTCVGPAAGSSRTTPGVNG